MSLSLEEIKSQLYVGMIFKWKNPNWVQATYKIVKINLLEDEIFCLCIEPDPLETRKIDVLYKRNLDDFQIAGFLIISNFINFKRNKYELKMSRN